MKALAKIPPRALGAAALAFIVALLVVTFTGAYRKPFGPDAHKVTAVFDRASQLYPGDQVRLDGDIDGKVTKVERDTPGALAKVTMDVDDAAGPVYGDARARIRSKTLLAGSFYVDIDRGSPAAGQLGSRTIPRSRTSVQVEIEDVTDIFRGSAMRGFQILPGEVAKMFGDPTPVVRDIATVERIAPDTGTGLRALRGVIPGEDLPRLVRATARAARALDAPRDELRTLVSGAAATVRTTGRRSAELRRTIAAMPGTADEVRGTLARLDTTLGHADRLVGKLQPAAPNVAPALAATRPALRDTGRLLHRAQPLLRRLPGLLGPLGTVGRTGVPLLDGLEPALRKADDVILPYLAAKDPGTGYSTTVMIGGTTAGFGGGSSGQLDANGRFIRFPASMSADSVYLPCKTSLIDASASSLLACNSFNDAIKNYLSYLPTLTPSARKGGR
jgi:virulence factor Mce-like protein